MKPPEDCASIEDVRGAIDVLDREIVSLVGRRAGYVRAAARFKTSEESVRDPERREAMLEERRRWAEEERLSPDVIEQVYRQLVSYFVNRELEDRRTNTIVDNNSQQRVLVLSRGCYKRVCRAVV